MRGPDFLKKKYNLHNTPEVKAASARTQKRTGEKVPQKPDAQIQNYLDRFKEILERKDPKEKERGLAALKEVLHRKFVIKAEDFPESYFDMQRKIARERGHGDIKISEAERKHHIDVAQKDQEVSLDQWIDYLASDDAPYEDWFKYYLVRNIGSLSEYDTAEKRFGTRTKDTTKAFPEVNSEAIAYMYDVVRANGGAQPETAGEVPDRKLHEAAKSGDFAKTYAAAIEKATAHAAELFSNIQGEWKKYDRGSDHMPLVRSVRSRGTGWCTAGEATAQSQLSGGDFHVYYSFDSKKEPTIPRIAIRMNGHQIAEVRGVAPNQNLDQYIAPVVEEKLKEFPDGGRYTKRMSDMTELTRIAKRSAAGKELTLQELSFLYEKDSLIEGFGQHVDPRIREIRRSRDFEHDMMRMYGVDEEHTAFSQEELKEGSILLTGHLSVDQDTSLPESLKYAAGVVQISYSAEKMPEKIAEKLIGIGHMKAVAGRLAYFAPLSLEIAHALEKGGYLSDVGTRYDAFKSLDADLANKITDLWMNDDYAIRLLPLVPPNEHKLVANHLIEKKRGWAVCENLNLFHDINQQEIAEAIISKGDISILATRLHNFKHLNKDIALKIAKKGFIKELAQSLDSFDSMDEEIAVELVTKGQGDIVLKSLEKFGSVDQMGLARLMIEKEQGDILVDRLFSLEHVDREEIGRLLLQKGGTRETRAVVNNLSYFKEVDHNGLARKLLADDPRSFHLRIGQLRDLDLEFAKILLQTEPRTVLYNVRNFKREIQPEIALRLLNGPDGAQFRFDLDKFDVLDTRVAERLLELDSWYMLEKEIDKFTSLSRKVDRELLRHRRLRLRDYTARLGKRAINSMGGHFSLTLSHEDLRGGRSMIRYN
jgi:hypothetical protein